MLTALLTAHVCIDPEITIRYKRTKDKTHTILNLVDQGGTVLATGKAIRQRKDPHCEAVATAYAVSRALHALADDYENLAVGLDFLNCATPPRG